MDNDRAEIQEYPTGIGRTFFMQGQDILLFKSRGHRVNQCFYLPRAFSGTHDEVVGEAANSLHIQEDDIRSLFIAEDIHNLMG